MRGGETSDYKPSSTAGSLLVWWQNAGEVTAKTVNNPSRALNIFSTSDDLNCSPGISEYYWLG